MKPLIGISTGEIVNKIEPWAPYSYGQTHYYSNAVLAAGGVPILIPFMPEPELRQVYDRLDGLLFAGGNDIDPKLYGEDPHPLTVEVSADRDTMEYLLLDWTLADDKPHLGICRGFQLMNVHSGGTLYQDITAQMDGASNHVLSTHKKDGQYIAHQLMIEAESRLAGIVGSTTIGANTHHHQGVKDLGEGLHAVAWSEDGLIEGLERHDRQFALGVQCHPESLYEIDEKWAAVFHAFVQAAHTPRDSLQTKGSRSMSSATPVVTP